MALASPDVSRLSDRHCGKFGTAAATAIVIFAAAAAAAGKHGTHAAATVDSLGSDGTARGGIVAHVAPTREPGIYAITNLQWWRQQQHDGQ